MLYGFKYSFAMDNGRKEVKESASYSVKSVSDVIEIVDKINGVEN